MTDPLKQTPISELDRDNLLARAAKAAIELSPEDEMRYGAISWRDRPLTELSRHQLLQALEQSYKRIDQLKSERDELERRRLLARKLLKNKRGNLQNTC